MGTFNGITPIHMGIGLSLEVQNNNALCRNMHRNNQWCAVFWNKICLSAIYQYKVCAWVCVRVRDCVCARVRACVARN